MDAPRSDESVRTAKPPREDQAHTEPPVPVVPRPREQTPTVEGPEPATVAAAAETDSAQRERTPDADGAPEADAVVDADDAPDVDAVVDADEPAALGEPAVAEEQREPGRQPGPETTDSPEASTPADADRGVAVSDEPGPEQDSPARTRPHRGGADRGGADESGPEADARGGEELAETRGAARRVMGGVRGRLTPRQARRLRMVAGGVFMVAMAVVLVVRLAMRTSVLVVGVYGAALILCGVVIELSRQGRTRIGTWLLVLGLVGAVVADWLLP